MRAGLGLDFGGVICERADAGEERAAEMPLEAFNPVPDAFCVIAEMNKLFCGRVWIVSKATAQTERMTREWLKLRRFSEMTGVSSQCIHFTRDRFGKRGVCLKFGITHFADDQVKALDVLRGCVKHLYLFGGDSDENGITPAEDWIVLGRLLKQSVPKCEKGNL